MEKEKNYKVKFISATLALTLASTGAVIVGSPKNAYAVGSKIVTSKPSIKYKNVAGHKIGEFLDENTGTLYYTVEVIENDNASRISEVIIATYNKEKQIPKEELEVFDAEDSKTKRSSFWPAVVYMNTDSGKKFRINPGDILIFPTEYEKFKELNGRVKASGWYSRYLTANKIYPPKKTYVLPKGRTMKLIQEIYTEMYPGEDICVDEDFVRNYLNAHNYNGKYVLKEEAEFTSEDLFVLTEWIPTLEELEETAKTKKKSK